METALNGAGLVETIENPEGNYYALRVFGYNAAKGAYELANFADSGMVSAQAGALSKDVREFTLEGRLNGEGPVPGMVAVKSVYAFIGEDELRVDEYAIGEDGSSYLGAQAFYRRRQ